ncbi:MAG: hypothetical protein M3272_07015 [Actinomycetota bacterium]|jgi:hypothetical protein|nr:hypothetical protein [Actinomycetota bacterium]
MTAEAAVAGGWIEDFRRASDEDAEIQAHGRYYSCAFLLDMEEHSYLVSMHAGKVEEILEDPGPLDERYQFVIRASAETWRNFAQDPPPPMYHGLFAASFRTDMSLEGDLLVLMQNLRCVVRQMELLRVTGVPV